MAVILRRCPSRHRFTANKLEAAALLLLLPALLLLLLLPAPELLLGHGMHWLARSPSPSVARRPSCEPEWQHGGGGDTTDVLHLCEASPIADEIGWPNCRTKKMLAMNTSKNVPALSLLLAAFECSIFMAETAKSGVPSSIESCFFGGR